MTPSRTRCSRPTAGCRRQGRGEEKVLVVVMTDGLENSSTDYDAHGIAELVRGYDERPNWTFVYLGAGHANITRRAARGRGDGLSGRERDALVGRPRLHPQVHALARARNRAEAHVDAAQERALLRGRRPVRATTARTSRPRHPPARTRRRAEAGARQRSTAATSATSSRPPITLRRENVPIRDPTSGKATRIGDDLSEAD